MKPLLLKILAISAVYFLSPKAQAQFPALAGTDSCKLAPLDLKPATADSLIVEKEEPKKSFFQAGISYLTDNVDMGRKDTTTLGYYSPVLAYYNKTGLYVKASLGYVNNAYANQIDEFSVEGGWDFSKGNYDGEISATKYWYSAYSRSVRAGIKESLSFSNGYDFGIVKPSFEGTISAGTKFDYAVGLGLEHSFGLFGDAMEITPKVASNASTLNFYDDFYRKRKYSVKKKNKTVTAKETVTGTVENPNAMKILDYEASAEITYKVGKFEFDLLPVYAIPVNPSVIDVTRVLQDGTVKQSRQIEKTGNIFYWSFGVNFDFK